MGCNCGGGAKVTVYVWTPAGGGSKVEFVTETAARARVIKQGGSYVAVVK